MKIYSFLTIIILCAFSGSSHINQKYVDETKAVVSGMDNAGMEGIDDPKTGVPSSGMWYREYTQGAWRWRNDDGDVYTATWRDSAATPVVLTGYDNIRLRVEFGQFHRKITKLSQPSGMTDIEFWGHAYADSLRVSLYYTRDPLNEEWFPLSGDSTGEFVMSPSQYLFDSMSYADNQLLSGTIPYPYRGTITFDSTNSHLMPFDEESSYEFEYSFRPTANIQSGSAYFFKLFGDSTDLLGMRNEYDYPTLITPPFIWQYQSSGTALDLYSVFFSDVNTGTIVGSRYDDGQGIILRTTDGGITWVPQSSNTNAVLRSVYFVNNDTGWVVGDLGRILKTTDGGSNWMVLEEGSNGRFLHAVHFTDPDTGTAVGYDDNMGSSIILRTNDGGKTWTQQTCHERYRLYGVHFTDVDTGTVVGAHGILRTTDGGKTWTQQTDRTRYLLYGVYFTDANNGTVVGISRNSNMSVILRTTNGGRTWISQLSGINDRLRSVYFTGKDTGWVVGDNGRILKTTDRGANWEKITSGTVGHLNAVHFSDANTGTVIGVHGRILRTAEDQVVGIKEDHILQIPGDLILSQNYPNPFNPSTRIRYTLPERRYVTITIYNMVGQHVAQLVDSEIEAGTHEVAFDASHLPSGVYIYRLQAGEYVESKKLVLIR